MIARTWFRIALVAGSAVGVSGLGSLLLAVCPKESPYVCACPEPSTTTKCDGTPQASCANALDQQKMNSTFACVGTSINSMCIDGLASDQVPCYNEAHCTWDTNQQKCIPMGLPVTHYKVKKVQSMCVY